MKTDTTRPQFVPPLVTPWKPAHKRDKPERGNIAAFGATQIDSQGRAYRLIPSGTRQHDTGFDAMGRPQKGVCVVFQYRRLDRLDVKAGKFRPRVRMSKKTRLAIRRARRASDIMSDTYTPALAA